MEAWCREVRVQQTHSHTPGRAGLGCSPESWGVPWKTPQPPDDLCPVCRAGVRAEAAWAGRMRQEGPMQGHGQAVSRKRPKQ